MCAVPAWEIPPNTAVIAPQGTLLRVSRGFTLVRVPEHRNIRLKEIAIYAPTHSVGMSILLLKDLCWAAACNALGQEPAGEAVRVVSESARAIDCVNGTTINADRAIEDVTTADAVFLGAFWGSADDALAANQAVLPWLETMYDQGAIIAGHSNSVFFLAEAGLLSGRVATIYPPYAESFRARYPDVVLHSERGITNADRLYCANGIATGCDLTVAIIEQLFGPHVARDVAAQFLLGFNRDYVHWNIEFDGQKYHQDRQVLNAQQWLERNFAGTVHIADVAAELGMSQRNLLRRFNAAVGEPPQQYLQRLRIEASKYFLQTTNMKVVEVASRSGYADLSSFNKVFKKLTGLTPSQYRDSSSI